MSDWKKLFKPLMLERGKDLYKTHSVIKYMDTTEAYKADVKDSVNYHVSLLKGDGKITGVSCSCAYAKKAVYCKHVAALMYTVENKNGTIECDLSSDVKKSEVKKEEKKEKKSKPEYVLLPFNDDGKPHYFSLGNSLDIYKPTVKTYEKALKLIENGHVKIRETKITQKKNIKYLNREVTITEGPKTARVNVIISRNGIINLSCQDATYWYSSHMLTKACAIDKKNEDGVIELCAHKTAALIKLIEFLENNRDIVDFSDPDAESFIESFKVERKSPIELRLDRTEGTVDIEPTIETGMETRCYLTLRILSTNGKYYKVRDISALEEAASNYWEYTSGQNCFVDFTVDKLNERAVKVLEFYNASKSKSGYSYYSSDKSSILLDDVWDEFFSIMKDTPVIYKGVPLEGFREIDSSPTLKIEEIREKNEVVGVKVSGKISGKYSSSDYLYYIDKGYLNRVEKKKLGPALSFLPLADSNGNFSFNVGLSLIDNFYQRVLPELRRYAKVEDSAIDSLEGKLTEPPQAVFYLDEEKGIIVCRPVFRYEGKEYRIYPSNTYYKRENEYLIPYEKDIAADLDEIFFGNYTSSGCWTVRDYDYDVYDFLHAGITILMEYGEVHVSDEIKKIIVKKMPRVISSIDIDEKDDSILNFTLDLQGFTVDELVEILEAYRDKKKFHRLKNGDFISLEEANLDVLKDLFFSSGIPISEFVNGKMHLPLYRALYLDQILQNREGLSLESGQRFKRLIKEFKTINESDYKIPSSLNDVLRSYQKDGYRWMRALFEYGFGGILADDMGLGKTIQALSLLLSMKEEGKDVKALIVSPASLVYNWKAECTRFTPSLTAAAVAGNVKEREEILNNPSSYDILITSYDLLKRDIAHYENLSFNVEIIDEAQFIKNHNTAQAKAVRAINAKNRLALTGTPIENRLLELWSIFEYLMPGFLFNQENFKKNISNPIEKSGDKEAAEKLKKLTGPFILRRIKSDVLKDLPDKIEETRVTPLEGEQLKLYTAEVAKTKGMLKGDKNFNEHKIEILAELMKIREICCDPSLIFSDYKGPSAKREAAMELIKSAIDGGHKILLFSQFTSMLALLEEDLKNENISYYKIIGDTGKAKRLALVDAFNSDDTPLFLISLKAGGTGLNLTSADIVIHYDPWWNVAVQNQATDRAHRIGQTKRVTVYKMICENTIEEKIVKLQETKKNLADEIVSTDNMSLSSMSKDDLMELLDISYGD